MVRYSTPLVFRGIQLDVTEVLLKGLQKARMPHSTPPLPHTDSVKNVGSYERVRYSTPLRIRVIPAGYNWNIVRSQIILYMPFFQFLFSEYETIVICYSIVSWSSNSSDITSVWLKSYFEMNNVIKKHKRTGNRNIVFEEIWLEIAILTFFRYFQLIGKTHFNVFLLFPGNSHSVFFYVENSILCVLIRIASMRLF